MGLLDEFRTDKSHLSVATTTTRSDAKANWQTRTKQERLAALESIRQIVSGYDPETTRRQKLLEVTRCP
jgi:hypothetical protein